MGKKITNEDLARMVAKGFENTATKQDMDIVKGDLETVKSDLVIVKGRLDHMDARLGRVEMDVAEIRGAFVRRDEFEDVLARIKYLELKAGIESGK